MDRIKEGVQLKNKGKLIFIVAGLKAFDVQILKLNYIVIITLQIKCDVSVSNLL
jgi:hypothetical protein